MTEQHQVENKNYLKASVAAKRVGYSTDYVTRLARSGKIDGERSGRHWYIDVDSLKLFSLTSDVQKKERNEKLKQTRTRERAAAAHVQNEAVLNQKLEKLQTLAIAQTAVLTAVCFVFFNLLWFSVESKLRVGNLADGTQWIADSLLETIAQPSVDLLSQVALFALVTEPEVSISVAEVSDKTDQANSADSTTANFEGVVIFEDENISDAKLVQVRESFSDEVVVEFDEKDSGVITPVFRERSGDSYRFLMVPINSAKE